MKHEKIMTKSDGKKGKWAVKIENKSRTKNPEEVVMNYASKLKLNIKDSYRLSWDDKYVELCKEQNKEIYNEVTFDKDMPSI